MIEIKYCPVCREELKITQGRKYCEHCKAVFYIQCECISESPPALSSELE